MSIKLIVIGRWQSSSNHQGQHVRLTSVRSLRSALRRSNAAVQAARQSGTIFTVNSFTLR